MVFLNLLALRSDARLCMVMRGSEDGYLLVRVPSCLAMDFTLLQL